MKGLWPLIKTVVGAGILVALPLLILAELVVDGGTPSAGEIGAFGLDRPALREAR